MVYSGNLNEDLAFYEVSETQSESGFKSTTETFKFNCRAYRMKNKEKLLIDAENVFHSNVLTFQIRYRTDITETDIVVYEAERYAITSIDPYKRENQMTIKISKLND